jgi:predicted TIM-barrel fold metal-dependent hydrolase
MKIDCHTHILYTGPDPGARIFEKEMWRSRLQVAGKLPADRPVTDEDWKELEFLFESVLPEVSIADHDAVGVDKIGILAVAPSHHRRYSRGTWDPTDVTKLPEPHTLDQVNDRIAALVKMYPDKFIGFGAVNPRYRGANWAVEDMERAITELGLTGFKLYPPYDRWSPDDRDLAWPIWRKAEELGVPVMIHVSPSSVSETKMAYARPFLLDDVGLDFPDLKVLVCHVGSPRVEECICLLRKHPNFYMGLSGCAKTRQEMFLLLQKCKRQGVPLSKACWGTDYPLDYPTLEGLKTLVTEFQTINEEAEKLDMPPFTEDEMRGMWGQNFLRFIGQ